MTLPQLHLADWRATKDTLHRPYEIVGKIRLATTAPRNHWWNVPAARRRPRPVHPPPASPRHHHAIPGGMGVDVDIKEEPFGVWTQSGSDPPAILPCEAVRTARDPRTALLAFCQGAYEAGARLADWDTASFESAWSHPGPAPATAPAPPPTSAGPKKGDPRCS